MSDIGAVPQETGNRKPATGNFKPEMGKGANIAGRLLEFGVAVLRLSSQMPRHSAGRHVSLQLVRSATSAGANYEEARAAESRGDFVHKLGIAAKEMREACYWVALVARSGLVTANLKDMLGEASELAAILGASARTARLRRAGEE